MNDATLSTLMTYMGACLAGHGRTCGDLTFDHQNNTADLTQAVYTVANSNEEKIRNLQYACRDNRNEICYGYVPTVKSIEAKVENKVVSYPMQIFRKATRNIVTGPLGAWFATNSLHVANKAVPEYRYTDMPEDVVDPPMIDAEMIKETNIIYLSQYRNTA